MKEFSWESVGYVNKRAIPNFYLMRFWWISKISWLPSPVFRISHFCKKSKNQPQSGKFPIKLLSVNKVVYCGVTGAKTILKCQILRIFLKLATFAKMSQNSHSSRLCFFSSLQSTFFGIVRTFCMKITWPCILPYLSPGNPRKFFDKYPLVHLLASIQVSGGNVYHIFVC